MRSITQGEMMNREILSKSLVAVEAIAAGDVISGDMIGVRSPGKGLQPNRLHELIGSSAKREMNAGDFFYASDLEEQNVTARPHYNFNRPWSIPVRYHDLKMLLDLTSPDLLEFHLSYKDMKEPLENYFDGPFDKEFAVHSPELFAGDHLMDLCAIDESYRRHSVTKLQEVIDLTRRMKAFFPKTERPMIITNVGGFSLNRHLTKEESAVLYDRVAASGRFDAGWPPPIPTSAVWWRWPGSRPPRTVRRTSHEQVRLQLPLDPLRSQQPQRRRHRLL